MPDEEEDTRYLTGGDVINMTDLAKARARRAGVDTRKKEPAEELKPPAEDVVLKPKTGGSDDGKPEK